MEYYHRGVVCHLIGGTLAIPLDIEMLRPGEGELAAALRLMERVIGTYGRLFDVVVGDALYLDGGFVNLCRSRGKEVIAGLKKNNAALLADAEGVIKLLEPEQWRDENRSVRLWDVEGFSSSERLEAASRVVHSDETVTTREHRGPQRVQKTTKHSWWWATTIASLKLPGRAVWQVGHARWDIENDLYEHLCKYWSLDHCYKHHPHAILNFVLTLFIAFVLVQSFYHRNLKPALRCRYTLIGIGLELTIDLGAPGCTAPWAATICGPAP